MKCLFASIILSVLIGIGGYSTALAQCPVTPLPSPTPVTPYDQEILNTQSAHLLAYWRLNETAGSVAADSSGNSRNGIYSGVTLNAAVAPDGAPAPGFDGINDEVNVYSSSLSSAFSGTQGTLLVWAKVSTGSVWTDATVRRLMYFAVDNNNRVIIHKSTNAGEMVAFYIAGGTNKNVPIATGSPTGWFMVAITWNKVAGEAKVYFNGSQSGSTLTGLGTWTAGSIVLAEIGGDTTSSLWWSGNAAHAAIWNVALSASELSDLYTVPTPPLPTPTVAPSCTATPPPSYYMDFTTPNGEPARVVREMRIADYPIILLLVGLLVSIWAMYLVRRLRGGR